MKILFVILLVISGLLEIPIDHYLDWIKKRTNQHGLTALMRWVLMGLTCFAAYHFVDLQYWRTAPLALSSHLLLFGPLYNKFVLKQPLGYLSDKVWWDRIEIWIGSKISAMGLIGIKLMLVLLSIGLYVYGGPCYGGGWDCF